MRKLASGLTSLCLALLLAGCATSVPRVETVMMTPMLPAHLTRPLPAPSVKASSNRDLLDLLARYESLRRRANADRAAVVEIMQGTEGETHAESHR